MSNGEYQNTSSTQQPHLVTSTPQGNGLAIASLVLGIVAIVMMCAWYIAIPCGILAIVFGVVGRNRAKEGAPHGGMAKAGLICGILGLLSALDYGPGMSGSHRNRRSLDA